LTEINEISLEVINVLRLWCSLGSFQLHNCMCCEINEWMTEWIDVKTCQKYDTMPWVATAVRVWSNNTYPFLSIPSPEAICGWAPVWESVGVTTSYIGVKQEKFWNVIRGLVHSGALRLFGGCGLQFSHAIILYYADWKAVGFETSSKLSLYQTAINFGSCQLLAFKLQYCFGEYFN